MHITLKGNPLSTGSIYKSHSRFGFPTTYLSNTGRALKDDYGWQVKQQCKKKPTFFTQDVEIHVKLFFGDKRVRDWDNFHKLSMDSLTGIVWEDDSQIMKATVEKFYDKKNPRIEIIIKKYE